MSPRNISQVIRFWLPPLLWAGVIFSFSARPSVHASALYWPDFIIKKTAHVTEYAIFALLLYRGFKNSGEKHAKLFAFLLAMFYAMTDEFHQRFTPGREPTLRDVIFDTIGASIGAYFIWKLIPKMPKRLKRLAENYQLL